MITKEDFKKVRDKLRKSHKYGAISCQRGGVKFPSKLERDYYDYLLKCQKDGRILFFLRQTPIHLPGRVKYVCDFVVFGGGTGNIQFIDVKGKITPTYKMKKKMVEDLYPIKIIEIKKGDF
jgi:Protein of unknown function (DUF1064)